MTTPKDDLQELKDSIKDLDHKCEVNFNKIETSIEKLNGAFPDGDIAGHKAYHEAVKRLQKERRMLRNAVKAKTIQGLLWALICLFGIMFWEYFQNLIKAIANKGKE